MLSKRKAKEILEEAIDDHQPDPRLVFATRMILNSGGTVSIDRIAGKLSMTRRHLERRFLATVGIGPKRLARITRFQRAVRVLEKADPRRRGALTAAACGYSDQAHFIRDFRELAGCSPAQHLITHAELTGFFVSGSRASIQRF